MARSAPRPWLLALVIGLLAAGISTLASAHGGDPTQIHGCISQGGLNRGTVMVYSAPGYPGEGPNSQCGTRGFPLDWSQQGPSGPVGPAGALNLEGTADMAYITLNSCPE
jgi:hypothetical protein